MPYIYNIAKWIQYHVTGVILYYLKLLQAHAGSLWSWGFNRRKIFVGSLYTAFTSQETFSKLKIMCGMIIVKVFFLDRVFEEGIYFVSRGDVFVILWMCVFMISPNMFFEVSVFTQKWFDEMKLCPTEFLTWKKSHLSNLKKLRWLFSVYHGVTRRGRSRW